MDTDNKITGPGYYPRRPTKPWMCLKPQIDQQGYAWYGWAIYRDLLRSVGVEKYTFILAKDSADACRHINKILPGAAYTSSSNLGATFSIMQPSLSGRFVGLHWPDGSWQLYQNATPQAGVMGRNVL